MAVGLEDSDEVKTSVLLYSTGFEALEVHNTFVLAKEKLGLILRMWYRRLKHTFPKSIEQYITELHRLEEICKFGLISKHDGLAGLWD